MRLSPAGDCPAIPESNQAPISSCRRPRGSGPLTKPRWRAFEGRTPQINGGRTPTGHSNPVQQSQHREVCPTGLQPRRSARAPSDGHPRSQLAAAAHGSPCTAAAAVPTPGARRGLGVPPRHTSAARAVLPGTGGGRHRGVARLMSDPPLSTAANALGGVPFTLSQSRPEFSLWGYSGNRAGYSTTPSRVIED